MTRAVLVGELAYVGDDRSTIWEVRQIHRSGASANGPLAYLVSTTGSTIHYEPVINLEPVAHQ